MSEILSINGTVVSTAFSPPELLRGAGIFDTMRAECTTNGVVIYNYSTHLERLFQGAAALGIATKTITIHRLEDELLSLMKAFDWGLFSTAVIRIYLAHNTIIIRCSPWERRLPIDGAHLITWNAIRPLPHLKHCSTIISEISIQEARKKGAHEALLLDYRTIVRECSWSNFFWIDKQGVLHTSENFVLQGITRTLVLTLETDYMSVSLDDSPLNTVINNAAEVFITNALHGIVPVTKIDEIVFAPGDRTKDLSERYEAFLKRTTSQSCFIW